ncbi:PREDICTED: nucleoredoxin-like protein 2 [Nicrophorus vespilloides]|uniref:Nucleoredoxin-like protein 2 n=1 Tax=Nicrophorus vespilloides TaxID=110193 RepID=A0ABM1MG73_NICVS|nr:PREDICTED: nucleoredoxin-like protein 2 [Nicrophorus vespilloides]
MEHLSTGTLLNCSGIKVEAAKAFKNRKIIAYYFSASWCGPCKQLLPKMKAIYKENKSRKSGLEIIFVSSDTAAPEMLKYFQERHGGWYAVPFEDSGGEILRQIYNITFIPQIIVTKDDGTIISREGTKDVEELGIDVLKAWNPSSI